MAYKVSDKYKEKRYSGDNDNQLYLEYNGVEVKDAPLKAENLKWIRRILDNGSKTLTLDNFVSQTMELSIRDYEISDTTKEFYIKIGSMVDGAYEYVPLGYYHIKDNPSTANGKTTYKLTDRSTRFDKFIDLSEFIKQNGGKITKLQAVQEYCRQCNVEFTNTSFLGSNEEIGIYDNTITARVHIMYLAECSGCIATIGRDGKLYFIPFVKPNSNNTHIIPERILNNNMNNSKGSFKISKVVWEGALMPFSKGNDTGDTLFLNTSNPYISKQEDIDRIYNQVVGLEIDNINTSSIIGDPSIDPWDYIQYTHTDDDGNDKETYTSLAQYDMEFNGVFKQSFNTSIDREKKKINSTVNSQNAKVNRLKQEIDNVNGVLKVTSEKVDENTSKIGSLEISNQGITTKISTLETGLNTTNSNLEDTNSRVDTLDGKIDGVSADFNDFKDNEYIQSINNLQDQIDGAIQFWNGASIPTLNNYPANQWKTENDRNNHRADIYTVIDDSTTPPKQGKSYRFDKVNGVWQWIELTDNELSAVQEIAQNALNKANKNENNINTLTKKTSELAQTDEQIKASVDEINNKYEQDITTSKTATGNPIEVTDAGEYPLESIVIDGKSEQETRSGKNLFDYGDSQSGTKNGITYSYDKSTGIWTLNGTATAQTDIAYVNAKTTVLQANTNYRVTSFYLSGTISGGSVISYAQDSQNSWQGIAPTLTSTNNYSSNANPSITLTLQSSKILIISNGTTLSNYKFKTQVELGTTTTDYELYGASPSPDYPSEIKNVEGIRNLLNNQNYSLGSIGSTGTDVTSTTVYRFNEYIPIKSNTIIYLLKELCIYYYDKDKNFISLDTNGGLTKTTPNNTRYVRFRTFARYFDTFNKDDYMVSYEPIKTYVPYGSWLIVQTTGKNLANLLDRNINVIGMNVITDKEGKISVNGTATETYGAIKTNTYSKPILKKGDVVSYSWGKTKELKQDSIGNPFIWLRNKDNVTSISLAKTRKTITITEDIYSILIGIENYVTGTTYDESMYCELEKSSTIPTSYEPYKENTALIDMNKPNLFDISDLLSANSEVYNGLTFNNMLNINLEPNTQYILASSVSGSISGDATNRCLYLCKNNETLAVFNGYNQIFTTDSTGNVKIGFINNRTYSNQITNKTATITLYKGNNLIPYYKLCSTKDGSVTDTINIDDIGNATLTKRIGEMVLNKSLFGNKTNILTNSCEIRISKKNIPNLKLAKNLKSNKYKYKATWNVDEVGIFGLAGSPINSIAFRIPVNAEKSFINETILQYELAEPYTIELNYEPLTLHKGYNNITLNDDLLPNMNVKYLTDSKLNAQYVSHAQLEIEKNKINSEINTKVSNTELDEVIEEQSNKITQQITDSENEIMLEVNKKVDDEDYTRAKIMAKITENGTSAINMEADKFSLTSNNFKVDTEGNVEANNIKATGGKIADFSIYEKKLETEIRPDYNFTQEDFQLLRSLIIAGKWTQAQLEKYDLNRDGKLDVRDLSKMNKLIKIPCISRDHPGHFRIQTGNDVANIENNQVGFFDGNDNLYTGFDYERLVVSGINALVKIAKVSFDIIPSTKRGSNGFGQANVDISSLEAEEILAITYYSGSSFMLFSTNSITLDNITVSGYRMGGTYNDAIGCGARILYR